MNREDILNEIKTIIEDILDDEIELCEDTVASDVDGWDSLTHILIINEIEKHFEIKIPMKDVVKLKNVGDLINSIQECKK